MSNGLKSTEFWVSILATMAGIYLATHGADALMVGVVVAPAMAYTGGRSLVKAKA